MRDLFSFLGLKKPIPAGRFFQQAATFSARMDTLAPRVAGKSARGSVGVVVMPWQQTAVPFFLIEWAVHLQREGCHVELIWDGVSSGTVSAKDKEEERTIRNLLEKASKKGMPIVTLPRHRHPFSEGDPRIERLAFEAATRTLGREPSFAETTKVDQEAGRLTHHAERVSQLLRARRYDWVLIPGGVWGKSASYWAACERESVAFTTFDSGTGFLCFQHGGPAAHFPDLPHAMQIMTDACMGDGAVRAPLEKWVNARMDVRRRGEDDLRLQPISGQTAPCRCDVLVPLNYRIDTAAMCRQRLFASVNAWLRGIVDWARQRPEVNVVVRQHPCEKIPAFRSREDYSWVEQSNVRFVTAKESVNTYDLIEQSRVVLPYTSRVGLEAGVLGRPVLLAAQTYYDRLDFARAPESVDAYFKTLDDMVFRPQLLTDSERLAAYAGYFVAENFGLYRTEFTPIPDDFDRWIQKSPEELWAEELPSTLLEAALTRLPAAEIFVHRQIARWREEGDVQTS